MNRRSLVLCLTLLVFVLAMSAVASETLTKRSAAPNWQPTFELDQEFNDSLFYHSFVNSLVSYTNATNFLAGIRFTAPADFQIQGFRFVVQNPLTLTDIQVRLYEDNNGAVGDLITEAWNGAPTTVTELGDGWEPPPPGWIELVLDEADYIEVQQNVDFWVVVGPMPGVDDWHLSMDDDDAAPGGRNKTAFGTNPANLTNDSPYDWIATLLGAYAADYVDMKAHSLYNDVQQFHMPANTEVNFSARFLNTGTIASEEGTVTFSVVNGDGDEVFNNEVAIRVVDPFSADTVVVAADQSWTPETNSHYMATATVTVNGEDAVENNSYLLLQSVVDIADWMIYDDDGFEVNMNPNPGRGWGVSFFPTSYPAMIDSMSWYFEDPQDDTDIRVWALDGNGETLVWSYTDSVVAGWNTFKIENLEEYPEGININEGFFIGGYVDAGYAFHADTDAPVSAANPDMPDVSSSVIDGVNYIDNSGNWGVRAKMGVGVAPDLVFMPADTTVRFNYALVGSANHETFTVENIGDANGVITEISIGQHADELSIVEDLPLNIAAGATETITVEWTPTEEGDITSAMMVTHNDVSAPPRNPQIIFIRGNAVLNVNEISADVPNEYFLTQNYPNPFNPTTGIRFGVKESGIVNLKVYNLMGQVVAQLVNESLSAGVHEVNFDATGMPSGLYFYEIEVNGFHSMRKMALVK